MWESAEVSWRSAIQSLTRLSSIPLATLNLPSSFAPPPDVKPYFSRQVTSLLKVSAAQSKATTKEGKKTGDIWGTEELRPYYDLGSKRIAEDERKRGVGAVVHGDYKLDNLVSSSTTGPESGLRTDLPPYRTTRHWHSRLGIVYPRLPPRGPRQSPPPLLIPAYSRRSPAGLPVERGRSEPHDGPQRAFVRGNGAATS